MGRYVQHWRPSRGKPGKPARSVKPKSTPRTLPPRVPSYTPRRATWLLLRPQDELSEGAARYLESLLATCPEMVTVRSLASEFRRVVRERDTHGFRDWLEVAQGSSIPELAAFGEGLERDRAEVEAALASEWSNGQVEGQINRLNKALSTWMRRTRHAGGCGILLA